MDDKNVMTDQQKMKFQAELYYMSASILMKKKEEVNNKVIDAHFNIKLTDEERSIIFLSLPAHCLFAFSTELYLKSLILNCNKKYNKIHFYDDLFEMLDTDVQKEIKEEFSKYFDGDLQDMLKIHRKDFEEIRYAAERVGGLKLLSFTQWFCDIVKIVADKRIAQYEKK